MMRLIMSRTTSQTNMPHINQLLFWCGDAPHLFLPGLHRTNGNNVRKIAEEMINELLKFDEEEMKEEPLACMQLVEFVYYFVAQVHGVTAVKKWLKMNQDKSVLDYVTSSDLAFTVLVYENYLPKWIELLEDEHRQQRDMFETEEDGSTAAHEPKTKKMRTDTNKKKRNKKFHGKWMKDPKTKLKYLETMWSEKGLERFKELSEKFASLKSNKEIWNQCKEMWDMTMKGRVEEGDCWVPTFMVEEENADEEVDGKSKTERGLFVFEDVNDEEEEQQWMQGV